jgi:type I restriction enzyme S subunit
VTKALDEVGQEESVDTWKMEDLESVAHVALGKTPRKIHYRDNGKHRIIKFRDLRDGKLDLSVTTAGFVVDEPAALKGLRPLRLGDVLVTASAHSGEQIGRKCAIVTDLPKVDGGVYFVGELLRIAADASKMESEWPFLWFSSNRGRAAIQAAVAGVHLTQGRARRIPIPVPAKPKQKEVIRWANDFLHRVRSSEARLSVAENLLRRLRKAVLRAAVSGSLTADWRESSSPHESAEKLVTKIAEDRRRRGVKNWKPSTLKSAIRDLPEGWTLCSVADIAMVGVGGTPARSETALWGGPIPWVSSGEVANCRIAQTRELITDSGLAKSSAKLYPPGTVLIAMIGEGKTRGQSAILDIEAATNQNVAGLVFDTDLISREYIWRWALAEYSSTRAAGRGGAQPALNKRKVADLVLPLPPREEQDEIARRVGAAFEYANRAAERVTASRVGLDRTADRVLAKAFAPAFNGSS